MTDEERRFLAERILVLFGLLVVVALGALLVFDPMSLFAIVLTVLIVGFVGAIVWAFAEVADHHQ